MSDRKITFGGAAHEVTGSCHHVSVEAGAFLVDCGFFQGKHIAEQKNADPFPFEPGAVRAVLLTHAHLDHTGRLPKLVKEGFSGPIFANQATIDLTRLVLDDTANILAEHASAQGVLPLYGTAEVERTLALMQAVTIGEPFEPLPGVSVVMRDAGHILGSTFLEIEADGQQFVFSGDVGNAPSPLLRAPERPKRADWLIIESTYGGSTHETHESRLESVHEAIDWVIERRGTLLVPTFAIERTQELLFLIDALAQHKAIRELPVYLDSPLAIEVTEVYRRYPDLLEPEVGQALKQGGDDPFDFPFLKLTRSPEASRQINHQPPPKVVIAGAGMMEGGRIHHHLVRYLDLPTTLLLIVGFQAVGTLGREIADGAERVHIFGEEIQVKARVVQVHAFSAHADEPQLLDWVSELQEAPKKTFCVHGEPVQSQALAQALEKRYNFTTHLPELGEEVAL